MKIVTAVFPHIDVIKRIKRITLDLPEEKYIYTVNIIYSPIYYRFC